MTCRCIAAALCGALLTVGLVTAAEPVRLDNQGDPLPAGAVLRLGTIRLQSQGGFAWMPDGQSIVTACQERLWFWNIADGRPIGSALISTGQTHPRYHIAVSRDGSRLACAAGMGGHVLLFDLKPGGPIPEPFDVETGEQIVSFALSPDGKTFVTGNYNQSLRLWNAVTGEPMFRLNLGDRRPTRPCLAFSPDGRNLTVGFGTAIRLFELQDADNPKLIENAHGRETFALVYTPDGKRLISSGTTELKQQRTPEGKIYATTEGQVRIWNVAESRLVQELSFPKPMKNGCLIALSPDSNQLVTLNHEQGLVWDLSQNKVVREFEGFGSMYSLSQMRADVDPTGRYLAFNCYETHLRLRDLTTGKVHLTSDPQPGGLLGAAAFRPDGRFIATGYGDGYVRLWDGNSGELIRTIDGGDYWQRGLAFADGGKLLAVCGEDYDRGVLKFVGALRVFSVPDGELRFESQLPYRATALAVSHDSRRVAVANGLGKSGGGDESESGPVAIQIWEVASADKQAELSGYEHRVASLGWSYDDRTVLAAFEDNTLRRIDAASAAELEEVNVPHHRVQNGRTVSTRIREAVFYDNGACALTHASFLPDVNNWELRFGKKLWSVAPGTGVWKLAISADERLIACAVRGENTSELQIWNAATQQVLQSYDLAGEPVYAIEFSPDSRRVLTGFWSGTALVWDVSEALSKLPPVSSRKGGSK